MHVVTVETVRCNDQEFCFLYFLIEWKLDCDQEIIEVRSMRLLWYVRVMPCMCFVHHSLPTELVCFLDRFKLGKVPWKVCILLWVLSYSCNRLCKMPRYHDRDRGERRSDRGGGYRSGDPYLSSNLYNRGGGGDAGLIDAGGTRLYIGRLSSRTRSQDLEDLFTKYGRYNPWNVFFFVFVFVLFLFLTHKRGFSRCIDGVDHDTRIDNSAPDTK